MSANMWLSFNSGIFSFCSKTFSWITYSILFRADLEHPSSNERIKVNLLLSFLSYLNLTFTISLGYLNPESDNTALQEIQNHFSKNPIPFLPESESAFGGNSVILAMKMKAKTRPSSKSRRFFVFVIK